MEEHTVKKTSTGRMWLDKGIVHHIYSDGLVIDMEKAKDIYRDRVIISGGKDVYGYIDARGLKRMDDNARTWLSEPERQNGLLAVAIVIISHIQKLLANLYLKVNRPKIPTKLFTSEVEALRWLEYQKLKN